MNNLSANVPRVVRQIETKSEIGRNILLFLLQGVRILDLHPANDPVFPTSISVDLIEGHQTHLTVHYEVGDCDEIRF